MAQLGAERVYLAFFLAHLRLIAALEKGRVYFYCMRGDAKITISLKI